jgi:hypothetical protein
VIRCYGEMEMWKHGNTDILSYCILVGLLVALLIVIFVICAIVIYLRFYVHAGKC